MTHFRISTVALLGISACGSGDNREMSGAASGNGVPTVLVASSSAPTAVWPENQCTWLTVADVESILGPLAGPPRAHEGGCLYPLPLDAESARRREMAQKYQERLETLMKQTGTANQPIEDRRPTEPAVIVQVRMDAAVIAERALQAGGQILAGWVGDSVNRDTKGTPPAGWDFAQPALGQSGFVGRSGELTVSVFLQAVRVPRERVVVLAAALRDRVPDRPVAGPTTGQDWTGSMPNDPDPCGLLAIAEAEAVLGALVVPPYRTFESSVYPHAGGPTCVYRTARHRAFRLTPRWSAGSEQMKFVRGIGGLLSAVMPGENPEAADTLEGPWDEAASDAATGDLVFLKGDRALQVSYGTSSTDAAGALSLAGPALERLARVKVTP